MFETFYRTNKDFSKMRDIYKNDTFFLKFTYFIWYTTRAIAYKRRVSSQYRNQHQGEQGKDQLKGPNVIFLGPILLRPFLTILTYFI